MLVLNLKQLHFYEQHLCRVAPFSCSLLIIIFFQFFGSREIAFRRAECNTEQLVYDNVPVAALVNCIHLKCFNKYLTSPCTVISCHVNCLHFVFTEPVDQHHLCQRMHRSFGGLASTESIHRGRSLHSHIAITGNGCAWTVSEQILLHVKYIFTARCHSQHCYFHIDFKHANSKKF